MTDRLRAAAQAVIDRWDTHPERATGKDSLTVGREEIDDLRAALAEQGEDIPRGSIRTEPEPVAWIWIGDADVERLKHVKWVAASPVRTDIATVPLYLDPPKSR